MKIDRRHFLKTAGLGVGALSLQPALPEGATGAAQSGFLVRAPTMHLGL